MRYPIRCLIPLLLLSQLFLAPSASAADWLYTVRPGDKLWTLAEKFCGTHTRWRDIASHNQLANPLSLRPGDQLRFPLEWLIEEPAVVRIVLVRGDVRVEHSGASNGRTLASSRSGTGAGAIEAAEADSGAAETIGLEGAELSVGAKIITGVESYANVVFADGSSMKIGPESEVLFDTLSAYRDTGMVDSRVRINRGSGASAVELQRGPGSVYRISTPLGVAAVRGTEFRTRATEETSFVETIGGAVDYIAAAGTSKVERGFGLKADASGVAVEQLLAAPLLAAPRTYGANESVSWQALTGAANYLVQIYSGSDLAEVLAQATVANDEFALASLESGTYVLGVRGVAASGLQGLEATQSLTIQNALPAPRTVRVKQVRREPSLLVSWEPVEGASNYSVVLTPLEGGVPLIDSTMATQLQFSNLDLAKYSVSVQASSSEIQGVVSEPAEARVRRPLNWGLGAVLLGIVIVLI